MSEPTTEAGRALHQREHKGRSCPAEYGEDCWIAEDIAAIEAQARADDPQYDGTDAAHPAWWRGSDHATAALAAALAVAEGTVTTFLSDTSEGAAALAEAMSGYIDNGESIHLDMSAGKGVLERLAQNGWHLAQTEYSGMIERLQDALERERKRVEHYMAKEADAEATIRRLREVTDAAIAWSKSNLPERARLDFILRGECARLEQYLRDTAPEGSHPDAGKECCLPDHTVEQHYDAMRADTAPEGER